MKMKKLFVTVPLGLTLLIPTIGAASAHEGEDHAVHTTSVVKASAAGSPEASNKAVDLRAALDTIFSEHAFLAVVAMQKGIEGKPDFDQAAAALMANADDLSAAVGSVYGEEGGAAFKEIWNSHIGYFVDYVKATGAKDETAKKKALADLDAYRAEQAKFLDTATEGRLKASELEAGLEVHVNQLLWAFDNYVAGDFAKAYDSVRESAHHMFGVGKAVSWAITDQFPANFDNKSVDTPAADLRADLNHLLSEHAALAIIAMQKGADGAADFETTAGALNENTEELSAAVGSVYGKEGGEAFQTIWSSHIGYFVDYVKATGAGDEAAKTQALKELDEYRVEQAAFLDTATEGRLKAADLEAGLKMHVDELLEAFDSYVAKDYDAVYPAFREAYAHMGGVALALTGAIADQYPEKFTVAMPAEMPKTGMGGMADTATQEQGTSANVIFGSILAAALIAVLAAIMIRRKSAKS